MNSRQEWFLTTSQNLANIKCTMYELTKRLEQMWQEEFRTTQENAMDVIDLSPYGIDYNDLSSFFINNVGNYNVFWDGTDTLISRERGKFARRVRSTTPNIINL